MSSGQPKTLTQTTEQTKQPWAVQTPFYKDLYAQAADALKRTNDNPFLGGFVAQATPETQQGMGMLTANAGLQANATGGLMQHAQDVAGGKFLDPSTNPFLAATVAAATRPLQQQFTNTVVPAITDRSIAEGAFGGSGHGLALGRAAEGLATATGDISARMWGENYARERGYMMNAPALMGQTFDVMNAPAMTMLNVGELGTANQQRALDDQRARWEEINRTAPWYGLGDMATLLASGGFGHASGTSTMPNPAYENPFMTLLKSGVGIASGVAGIGGKGGFGWWGGR